MKLYITFGQVHRHEVNGQVFDKDSVCEIDCKDYEEGREKAFAAFGPKFAFDYDAGRVTPDFLQYFPRGIIPLEADNG